LLIAEDVHQVGIKVVFHSFLGMQRINAGIKNVLTIALLAVIICSVSGLMGERQNQIEEESWEKKNESKYVVRCSYRYGEIERGAEWNSPWDLDGQVFA
jgi:hypothetical protein